MEFWGEEALSEELEDDPTVYSEADIFCHLQESSKTITRNEGFERKLPEPRREEISNVEAELGAENCKLVDNNFDSVFENELEDSVKSRGALDLSDVNICDVLHLEHNYSSVSVPYTQNDDIVSATSSTLNEEITMNISNVAEDLIVETSFNNENLNSEFEDINNIEVINETEITNNVGNESLSANEIVEGRPPRKTKLSPSNWKREKTKRLRMEGLPYLGFSKPKGEKSRHDTPRDGRKLGVTCSSLKCAQAKNRNCEKFTERFRMDIFEKFWKEMNCDQRKVYVVNLVQNVDKKRKITKEENSRREVSREFHLYLNNERVQVCKTMFLNTLGIKGWTVRHWLDHSSGSGIHKCKEVKNRSKRETRERKRPSKELAYKFLQSLPTLPSHYCRSSSTKMYLEQYHTSHLGLYNVYREFCEGKNVKPVGRKLFMKIFNELNLALYSPKKDKCDVCCAFEVKQIDQETYDNHLAKKERARTEKNNDKHGKNKDGTVKKDKYHVFTMDVQAVKICPFVYASALYYKTKLNCHNFTVYNLASHEATCYWFNESEADLSADTFATCIVHKIKEVTHEEKRPIILYSDGCTYQNRNCVMSNALLHLSVELGIDIYQKFLEKGHTQMECDSVHSAIEQSLKKREIFLPSDYIRYTKDARSNPSLYNVVEVDHTFVKNYSDPLTMVYKSIRPGLVAGDPTVNNLRGLWYKPEGQIFYKLDFDEAWKSLPRRPKKINFPITFNVLNSVRLKIPERKYQHLQELKQVLPSDCHSFYDSLPH